MALKKEDVAKLSGVDDATRADLFSLFETIEAHNTRISDLTKKVKDSDQVVAENATLKTTIAARDQEKATLETKLSAILGRKVESSFDYELTVFKPFFDIFGGGEETPAPPPAPTK